MTETQVITPTQNMIQKIAQDYEIIIIRDYSTNDIGKNSLFSCQFIVMAIGLLSESTVL